MKIGIDARLYEETGVGRYIRNLLYWLIKLDKKNKYVIFTTKSSSKHIKNSPSWKIEEVNIRWHTLAEQVIFPFHLMKHKLDLVHFPYFSVPMLYSGKFIVTIHDLTNLTYPTGKASELPYVFYKVKHTAYKQILKNAIKRAEKIIVPSHSIANEMNKYYQGIGNKITVTYEGGIEIDQGAEKKYDFEPFFLYVGNVYPHKNIENAILALKKINLQNPKPIKLVIIGKKDYFQQRLYKYIKELELNKCIIFFDQVNDRQLSNLYKKALCLIFPSISEGFGLPALEAMQHGCLIACSDIPVFHEICGEPLFYFNPYDVDNIKQTFKKIISLSEKEKALLAAKEKERAGKFSWENMARQTLAIYEEVLR